MKLVDVQKKLEVSNGINSPSGLICTYGFAAKKARDTKKNIDHEVSTARKTGRRLCRKLVLRSMVQESSVST